MVEEVVRLVARQGPAVHELREAAKVAEAARAELRAAAEKIANPRGYPATKEELEKSSPATKAIMDRLAELAGLRDRATTTWGDDDGREQ